MYKLKTTARKFWCLEGFVAIIFTLLALRAIHAAFIYISFLNILMAALMSIFAYWWLKRVLAKPGGCTRGYSNHNDWSSRDIDL